MFSRRFFLVLVLFGLSGCSPASSPPGKISIGVVSYGESDRSVEQYAELQNYLGEELNSLVELEPTYNEVKALEQIKRKTWDIVFAPPGLAAIAISQSQYSPIFPLEGGLKSRSVIVVLKDSPLTQLQQLSGKVVALGERGSATGYYLPLYNFYGLTLAEVRFAATPKIALAWVAQKEVAASAMSLSEYTRYRSEFPNVRFRILYTDAHNVPSGAVLVSASLDAQKQEQIRKSLANVSGAIAASAGYVPNAAAPDYQYLIEVVSKVSPIAGRIKQKPAPLY
ncbi:MAG: phosphate/phosphite/phosphonate ABC transporter substrate-binding protein [Brasilonema sp.]